MKRIKQVISLLLSILIFCSTLTGNVYANELSAEIPTEPDGEGFYALSIEQEAHGTITISGEGESLLEIEANQYSVLAGSKVNVSINAESGYEVNSFYINGDILELDKMEAEFVMPETDVCLKGIFKEQEQMQEEDQDDIQNKEEKNLEQEKNRGIDISSYQLERTTTRKGTPNVGDKVTGTCYIYDAWMEGSQSYFNVGDFSGDLAGCYVTERIECLDHTAAEPTNTTASYEATVTEVNTKEGYIEYSIYITPPGVTDGVSRDENGNLYGYQHIGGKVRVKKQFLGSLDLYKASARPDMTDGNSCYSLEGAEYGLYKDGELIKTATTDSNGYAKFKEIKAASYILKEIKPPKGYALDRTEYPVTIHSGQATRLNVKDYPQSDPIGILLGKVDAETNQNKPQGSMSLKNAEFTVKYYAGLYDTDPSQSGVSATRMWILKTDEDGFTAFAEEYKVSGDAFYTNSNGTPVLPLGTITIQESKAPSGYAVNEEVFLRQIKSDGITESVHTYNQPTIPEQPVKGGVLIEKWDAETDSKKPQGGATLAGAEFQIISLNQNPVMVEGKSYQKNEVVTTISTNEEGQAKTGLNLLPYGTYKCLEVKSPTGYNPTGILERKFSIKKENQVVKLDATDTAIKNNVIRGDLQLVKFREDTDEEEDQKTPLKGIIFTITSKTTGKSVEIVTDKNGYASTAQLNLSKRGNLVYDTYIVHESNTPEGLKPVKDFEVTIQNEGETLYYILEDKQIVSPVRLVKVDSSTGKQIPIAGAEFQLLDENKNLITMTTHYPNEVVHETFQTDDSGSFTLPEKLKTGTYYFRELHAPEGYLKGEDLKFEIKEGHDWEEPVTVTFEDRNVIGKIVLHKTDEETKKPVRNAKFEVRAAENIVTPDGTLRLAKGDTADMITTDTEGRAETKALYLGKYVIQEVEQANGYILNKKEFKVELRYEDQTTELVYGEAGITNKPSSIKVIKTDQKTGEPLADVSFRVWNKAMAEEPDSGIMQPEVYTTDQDGVILLKYLQPGTYCFQETRTVPGYVLNESVFELVVSADGRIDGEEAGILEVENVHTELIGTKAKDQGTGTQEAVPKKETKFLDTVEFKNLQVGQEYTVKGTLMDKASGRPLIVDGIEVTAEHTFTAQTADGTVDVEFTFDATGLKGKEIVVFEKVFVQDIEIAAHEDIEDQGQTIRFPDTRIGTQAKDQNTGTQEAVPKKKTTIEDTVEYTNLIVGQEYTVKGILMEKASGEPLLAEGKQVTAEKTFTAEKKNGSIVMTFTFDASALKGKEIVVFEKMLTGDTEVAVHEDITDAGQTIRFPDHQIQTSARDAETGTQEAIARKDTTIIDCVKYTGLVPGQKYTVKGILMEKKTEKPLEVKGKKVTAEKDFIPETADGETELEFTFDSSELNRKTIVVFEYLYIEDEEVAAHADIQDEGQTVKIKVGKLVPSMPGNKNSGIFGPKTGDTAEILAVLLILIASGTVLGIVVYKRRRREHEE